MLFKYAKLIFLLFYGLINIENISAQNAMQRAHEAFTKNILKVVMSKKEPENLVISPFYIETLLILAMYGSKDALREEIKSALQLNNIKRANHLTFIKKTLKRISAFNKLYYSNDLTLKSEFLTSANSDFNIQPEKIDLSNSHNCVISINQKIRRHTQNLLNNLLEPDFIQISSGALFLSAIDFHDQWEQPFQKQDSLIRRFKNSDNSETDAYTIYGVVRVPFADLEKLNAMAVQLPYQYSGASLLLILPNDANSVNSVLTKMTTLTDILDELHIETVAITVPKIRIETHLDMADTFADLGIKTFTSSQPNFPAMFREESRSTEAQFMHGANFEINEYGCFVKYQKEISTKPTLKSSIPTKFFVATNPFIFILHKKGVVYLAGRINTLNAEASKKTGPPKPPPPKHTKPPKKKPKPTEHPSAGHPSLPPIIQDILDVIVGTNKTRNDDIEAEAEEDAHADMENDASDEVTDALDANMENDPSDDVIDYHAEKSLSYPQLFSNGGSKSRH